MAQPTNVKDIGNYGKTITKRDFIGVGNPNDDTTIGLNDIDYAPLYSTYLDVIDAEHAEENPVLYMKVVASWAGDVPTYGWGVCYTVADPA